MAVTITPLGFKKPDGNELVRGGDNAIADNAQKAEERLQEDRGRLASIEAKNAAQDGKYATFSARIGQAEANIAAGTGSTGVGLSEDPDNPGTYFMADTTPTGPIQPDPVTPGLYTF